MAAEEWKVLKEEAEDEAIKCTVEDIRRSNFTTMPEDIHLWVFDDDFPETTIRREGNSLICEITGHIYSKFWWHKFSAGAFSEAMERAVVRLSREGHPFRAWMFEDAYAKHNHWHKITYAEGKLKRP